MNNTTLAGRTVPWIAYPTVLTIGLALHLYAQHAGMAVSISANSAVLLGALLITLLEFRFPHIEAWKPRKEDIQQDLLYMVLVQMVFPKVLVFLFILALVEPMQSLQLPVQQWWPHQLPIGLQAVLMVLLADFLRYWLHRAAHHYQILWRLHAVHHSPPKLYWLNVGRFHPFEKALQFVFDSLPFLLLGVDAQVIALYFVFYAINGFFQHSNIEVRYGLLNYLISSAELHRWHHSRAPDESNTNFGNNIIIWDLLFGTWFLPRNREIEDIGLKNRHYPLRFAEQLRTPFTPHITDQDVPLQSLNILHRLALWLRMQPIYWRDVRPLQHAAQDPNRAQQKILQQLLNENRDTQFGKEHDFAAIKTHADFVHRIPVQDYESLRPYIDAQDTTETPVLTKQQPLLYALTSGTTGQPKYIPIVATSVQQYRREQRIFSWVQYQACPQALQGKVFCFAAAAEEGVRASGKAYGSVSGYLYQQMPRLVRRQYVVPPEVFALFDYSLKYKVMLRLALAERNITFLAGANPSSFLRLLTLLNDCREEMIASLEQGSLPVLQSADAKLHQQLLPRLAPDAARAQELCALTNKPEINFNDLWPHIKLLTVWTGGSCGVALQSLQETLPPATRIMELGYLASELRATLTIDTKTGAGLPTLQDHFFEFITPQDWEEKRQHFLTLNQLQPGMEYYVIVTTASGLYRYFMHDIVRVTGRYRRTPTLAFVRKGKGATNITGEKVYEDQILCIVRQAEQAQGFTSLFLMAIADEQANAYTLYIEPSGQTELNTKELAKEIDTALAKQNVEYQAKRESGRLQPLQVVLLQPGTGEAYKKHCLAQGQREGQFKVVALQYRKDTSFAFDDYRLS